MEHFPPEFVDGFLELHNEYREFHNSSPLEIVDELNELAQEWADDLAKRGVLAYKSDPEYGENIFLGDTAETIKPEDPLKFWYREGRYFKYGEESVENSEDVRHFTQLVWAATTSVGLGMATDSDGKVYFVCFYQPPGNVSGEYAENVLSPVQEEREMLPHEAERIRTIELPPKATESMERLYAVPSEKLRVWSVWLTKIGEIADEWQRWLRSNIDLAVRIAEHLEAAEEAMKRSDMETGDKPDKVSTTAEQSVPGESSESGDTVEKIQEEPAAVTPESPIMPDGKDPDQADVTDPPQADKTDAAQADETDPALADEIDPAQAELEDEMPTWPLGIPWEPTVEEEVEEEEEMDKLPMPSTEEEMEAFLKRFTHEATIYRSYYKHWRETADQATKEIGGRLVMATFIVQGKRERALKLIAKTRSLRKSRSIRKTDGSKVEIPKSSESKSSKSMVTAEATSETTSLAESVSSEAVTVIPNVRSKTDKDVEDVPLKTEKPPDESLEVNECFRNAARAMEPIPYFFFVKAEPDIDIAIEHDDEEVFPADTDREKIVADCKRIWFNLAEKPCKGGKPWI